jgi:hypothetical protein
MSLNISTSYPRIKGDGYLIRTMNNGFFDFVKTIFCNRENGVAKKIDAQHVLKYMYIQTTPLKQVSLKNPTPEDKLFVHVMDMLKFLTTGFWFPSNEKPFTDYLSFSTYIMVLYKETKTALVALQESGGTSKRSMVLSSIMSNYF